MNKYTVWYACMYVCMPWILCWLILLAEYINRAIRRNQFHLISNRITRADYYYHGSSAFPLISWLCIYRVDIKPTFHSSSDGKDLVPLMFVNEYEITACYFLWGVFFTFFSKIRDIFNLHTPQKKKRKKT